MSVICGASAVKTGCSSFQPSQNVAFTLQQIKDPGDAGLIDQTFRYRRSSLLQLAERLIVMDRGRIVADGPKETVMEALKQGRVSGAR